MINACFNQLFHQIPTAIESLPGGITNDNKLVTLPDGSVWVIRLPYPDNAAIMNYSLEKRILDQLKTEPYMIPLTYYDTETGIKISPYIPNLDIFESHTATKLKAIAITLKSLHQQPVVHHEFDIDRHYRYYRDHIQDALVDLGPYESILDRRRTFPYDGVLCHNDLVAGNICFQGEKNYLIDFEYAGDNDLYFDLMSVLSENKIDDPTLRLTFLETYFDSPLTRYQQDKLDCYEAVHNLLWCAWAQMSYNQTQQSIFKTIALEKYTRLMP